MGKLQMKRRKRKRKTGTAREERETCVDAELEKLWGDEKEVARLENATAGTILGFVLPQWPKLVSEKSLEPVPLCEDANDSEADVEALWKYFEERLTAQEQAEALVVRDLDQVRLVRCVVRAVRRAKLGLQDGLFLAVQTPGRDAVSCTSCVHSWDSLRCAGAVFERPGKDEMEAGRKLLDCILMLDATGTGPRSVLALRSSLAHDARSILEAALSTLPGRGGLVRTALRTGDREDLRTMTDPKRSPARTYDKVASTLLSGSLPSLFATFLTQSVFAYVSNHKRTGDGPGPQVEMHVNSLAYLGDTLEGAAQSEVPGAEEVRSSLKQLAQMPRDEALLLLFTCPVSQWGSRADATMRLCAAVLQDCHAKSVADKLVSGENHANVVASEKSNEDSGSDSLGNGNLVHRDCPELGKMPMEEKADHESESSSVTSSETKDDEAADEDGDTVQDEDKASVESPEEHADLQHGKTAEFPRLSESDDSGRSGSDAVSESSSEAASVCGPLNEANLETMASLARESSAEAGSGEWKKVETVSRPHYEAVPGIAFTRDSARHQPGDTDNTETNAKEIFTKTTGTEQVVRANPSAAEAAVAAPAVASETKVVPRPLAESLSRTPTQPQKPCAAHIGYSAEVRGTPFHFGNAIGPPLVVEGVEAAVLDMLSQNLDEMSQSLDQIALTRRPWQLAVAERIRTAVQSIFPGATTRLFGSLETGLAAPCSDVDMVVQRFGVPARVAMRTLADHLRGQSWVQMIQSVEHTSVPVIKLATAQIPISFGNQGSLINVDITFDSYSHTGLRTCALVRRLMASYPPLKPLTLVIKQFLVVKGLNDPFVGGLSSYGLVLMVTAILQRWFPSGMHGLPCPSNLLGAVLMTFLREYANPAFIERGVWVHMDPAATPDVLAMMHMKSQHLIEVAKATSPAPLYILDPSSDVNSIFNVGRTCFGIHQVVQAFAEALEAIELTPMHANSALSPNDWSVLGSMFTSGHHRHVVNLVVQVWCPRENPVAERKLDLREWAMTAKSVLETVEQKGGSCAWCHQRPHAPTCSLKGLLVNFPHMELSEHTG
ncbi:PolyA RNA polymerase cid14 [Hondaea fermentalgiana]|uniref:PolyA RNA polymerase cid14 n=1 Tax=Hondaea fermentalgiana TaxID=2315210 RepID=A0A2R5GVM8_9STRA|nr:PolyA RNA polymerase cid14 [Hondaea fermentalgiana]|eukprot:GBG32713.1 PolyA RNA polymerase cid14 [Hondaea fermentalgiana]